MLCKTTDYICFVIQSTKTQRN